MSKRYTELNVTVQMLKHYSCKRNALACKVIVHIFDQKESETGIKHH